MPMPSSAQSYSEYPLDWECPHEHAALVRDVTVARGIGPWYVSCASCGAAGPTADTADEARDAWLELVEVLDVWCEIASGDVLGPAACPLSGGWPFGDRAAASPPPPDHTEHTHQLRMAGVGD